MDQFKIIGKLLKDIGIFITSKMFQLKKNRFTSNINGLHPTEFYATNFWALI